MSARGERRRPRVVSAVMREGERVTPLELFFDLVFVLALTQCATLMAGESSWRRLLEGLLVLAMLWWSWVGYAWLTSVVDPEEGLVRLVVFAAMGALLVAALCVPGTFGKDALTFALAYAVVRIAHILLFMLASREDGELRHAVLGLALSTAVGAGLIVAAAFAGGDARLGLWGLAVVLDFGGPLVIDTGGWRLVPGHFAERHGADRDHRARRVDRRDRRRRPRARRRRDRRRLAARADARGLPVVGVLRRHRDRRRALPRARETRQRAEPPRTRLLLLPALPMVAGIALLAVGLKVTLAHVSARLGIVAASALVGGTALYLLAQFAFRVRTMHTYGWRRLLSALVLLAVLPLERSLSALALLGAVTAILVAMISYEALRYADVRDRVRHRAPDHG